MDRPRRDFSALREATPAPQSEDTVITLGDTMVGAHGPDARGNVRGVAMDLKTGDFAVGTINTETGERHETVGHAAAIRPGSVSTTARPYLAPNGPK